MNITIVVSHGKRENKLKIEVYTLLKKTSSKQDAN